MTEDEQMKSNIRGALSLSMDYSVDEILEALILNDRDKINEIRRRVIQLKSAYSKFVEDVDGPDKDQRKISMSTFKRPEK